MPIIESSAFFVYVMYELAKSIHPKQDAMEKKFARHFYKNQARNEGDARPHINGKPL